MATVTLDLDNDLIAALGQLNQPIDRSARELIVVELFRRGLVSGGKAADRLGMTRLDFVEYADRLGIPYSNLTPEEWESERALIDAL